MKARLNQLLYLSAIEEVIGMYYLNARYYKPDMKRFISRDPNPGSPSEPQSLNIYTYCGNNPVSRVDTDGKHWIPVDYVAKQIKKVQQYARNNGYPPPDRVVNHFGNSNGGSYYGHNARHTRKGNVSGRSTNKLVSTYKARKAVKADIGSSNTIISEKQFVKIIYNATSYSLTFGLAMTSAACFAAPIPGGRIAGAIFAALAIISYGVETYYLNPKVNKAIDEYYDENE